ncbi:metal-dependent hydrolase [Oceanobacillus halotolerans]|uniref:metal-dependent hydrolase n=1 Tax=Oceanobacillus halotolerans TaxID=2663380 RepID=UPI0013DC6015|nr:metal-dependent hydrolase [Oceanobacillus halotolerans]
MDTGTHIVMGVALGGLATIDPVVQQDPTLFQAVLVGTIVGSHAPDFDTILKLKNNATYIRHHRGATHSIPAIIIWGILIASVIYMVVPQVNFFHLWAWTFLAVIIHVFVDIFNAYGTQAYRPFTNKWVAHGFINTFDPYIFFLHVAGIIAWLLGANPGYTWIVIYTVILLYYVKRYLDKKEIVKKIHDHFPETEKVATSPTIKQNIWRVAITTTSHFYVGTVENGHIEIIDEFEKVPLPSNDLMEKVKKDKNVSAFLSFSPIYRWEINEYDNFTEVRFIDLRYRSKGHYPFVAVVHLDQNMDIISSYTGWIFSEHKLQHKLFIGDNPV